VLAQRVMVGGEIALSKEEVGVIGAVQYGGLPGVGFHFIQQTEAGGGSNPYTAYGGATLSSLRFEGKF
jgi:hypothetical protein